MQASAEYYFDFYGSNYEQFPPATAYATHDSFYLEETLAEEVQFRYEYVGDSSQILPAETRGGVEVIPVNTWRWYDLGTEKTRDLCFLRKGNLVTVKFVHYAAYFDTSADLRYLDSSLTFFESP